ncbi:RNA-binding protein 43 isoform X2 [Calypte anna]|uniref:RNA-binding protein 43 isoform X2 n=1 Tax=Calypte anna TaxID=9244 RepID=UPI0011C40B35|nr:RNA-binding protein 43 isoform X2 [Calypte anna]
MASGEADKSARRIVVTGVPHGLLHHDVMTDILIIHFQKSRNNGGDVEEVKYPTEKKGVAYVTFEDPAVVESVLKKDQHRLEDQRLSRSYPLTVTRYCGNVFSSVTSLLNMSVFKDHLVLEELIQELQKKSTDLSFGPLQPNGTISVQGSFPAIQSLRDFLFLKAKSLSEKEQREDQESHQRPQRRLQQHRLSREPKHPSQDGEKQVVVLDTDTYHYMKCFFPKIFQINADVVISDTTDGDVTTVCIESRSGAGQALRVRENIESQSVKLHQVLRKERIYFEKCTREEKNRYTAVCKSLRSLHPSVLTSFHATHLDIIGTSSEIFKFTKEMSSKIQKLSQAR